MAEIAAEAFGDAAAAGVLSAHARADHRHAMPAGVVVAKGGAVVGTRPRVNLIEGANVTLTVTDDAGNGEVDVTVAAAIAGSAATVHAEVHRSSNQTGVTPNTYTAVSFNAETDDPGGFHDNATNPSRLTVPAGEGGDYELLATVGWRDIADAKELIVVAYKNGVITDWRTVAYSSVGPSWPAQLLVASLPNLVAGDFIEVFVRHSDTVNRDLSSIDTRARLLKVGS